MEISERKSFILHKDRLAVLEDLTDKEAGILFKAIYTYQTTGHLPKDIDRSLTLLLKSFTKQFDADLVKWATTREKRIENGRLGGLAKASNQSKPKQTKSEPAEKEIKKESKYLDISEGFIDIMKRKQDKSFKDAVLENWRKHIRLLIDTDLNQRKSARQDVIKAIQAVEDNYGNDYFPVIESGNSLRSKFTKIEAYLKRSQKSKISNFDEHNKIFANVAKQLGI